MKKILLSLMLVCAFTMLKAQLVVLNDIYGNPGAGKSEFVELFNSGAPENLDCYTMVVYYENENSSDKGWYVIDFPSIVLNADPDNFFVLAAASPFNVQDETGVVADLNWNSVAFRTGADSYLKQYDWSGGTLAAATYTEITPLAT